jgi:hypothetical protein
MLPEVIKAVELDIPQVDMREQTTTEIKDNG